MNKWLKTIGLLGVLFTMIVGIRFMANQSDDTISSSSNPEQELSESSRKENEKNGEQAKASHLPEGNKQQQ